MMAIRLLLLALLVALAVPAGAQDHRALGSVSLEYLGAGGVAERRELYSESHALLIGVSDYTAGWPDLPGVRGDIEAVAAVLGEHGFQVRTVLDPPSEDLAQTYRSFIADHGQNPKARLLFYFAGHGHTRETQYGGVSGYIVPADAPLPQADWAAFRRKALNLKQIETFALDIDAAHALFLFDSCFSGSILGRAGAITPPHISAKVAQPVRQFLTAGAANQTVPDESVFRRQLCDALRGAGDLNGDGYVTAMELYGFVQEKVTYYSNGSQTPLYGTIRDDRLDKGDFVFRVPGASPAAPEAVVVPEFSANDLLQQARAREEAEASRRRLEQAAHDAFSTLEQIEANDYITAADKAAKWKEYLDKFEAADYQLAQARERHQFWLNWTPPTPTPSPSPTPKPGEPGATKTLDLGGGASMRLVWIPAGDGMAGFWMGETEVTQAQWKAVMGNNPSEFKGDDRPVETVSWHDAVEFCEKVSSRTGTKVELPTSEQWGYACRAGTTTTYYFGDDESRLGEYAWYKGNSGGETHPVRRKKPNAWGLYDMHGNVWEWTSTWSGSYRVRRGGSWNYDASYCRSGSSFAYNPDYRSRYYGFRLSCLPGK